MKDRKKEHGMCGNDDDKKKRIIAKFSSVFPFVSSFVLFLVWVLQKRSMCDSFVVLYFTPVIKFQDMIE